jgi:Virulence factor BrkB
MFPLMLGLIALVGLFPQSDEIKGAVEKVLVVAFPPSEQAGMLRTFQNSKTSAGALALFSLLALLWSGTNLFASMEFALNQIYLCATRPFWRTRLMGMAMLGVFLVAVGASVGIGTALAIAPGLAVLGFVFGWIVMTALLMVIYRVVPNRFSEAWPGALVAGLQCGHVRTQLPWCCCWGRSSTGCASTAVAWRAGINDGGPLYRLGQFVAPDRPNRHGHCDRDEPERVQQGHGKARRTKSGRDCTDQKDRREDNARGADDPRRATAAHEHPGSQPDEGRGWE